MVDEEWSPAEPGPDGLRFGERVRLLRDRAGYDSQEKLGKKAGVGVNSVSQWEKHHTLPKGETVVRLAGALGVDAHYLLTGEEPGAGEAQIRLAGIREALLGDLEERVPRTPPTGGGPPQEEPTLREILTELARRSRAARETPTRTEDEGLSS